MFSQWRVVRNLVKVLQLETCVNIVPVDRVNEQDQWISKVNLGGHVTKGRGTRKKNAEGIAAATGLARLRKEKEDQLTLVKELLTKNN